MDSKKVHTKSKKDTDDKYDKYDKSSTEDNNSDLPVAYIKKAFKFIITNLNIISLILIGVSVLYYIESLRGCHGTQAECLKNLNEGEVRELLWLLQKAALILASIVTGIIFGYISNYILIVITIIYGFLCFYYDTGADLDYHGSYNRVILFLMFVLFFSGINLLILIYKGLMRKTILTSAILLIVTFCIFAFYKIEVTTSCKDWMKGLKDTEVSQENMPCKIKVPEACWIDIFGGLFDYSGWFKDNCSVIRNGDRALYDKYLLEKNPNYKKSTLIGFPRTEHYTYDDSIHFVLDYKVMRELVDMDDPDVPESIKNRTEVMVDYRGEESKVTIRIVRDENLIKQRLPLYERLGKTMPLKNLLIVYIDSFSRRHFHRRMPKVSAWIDKFYKTGHSKYTSYQFLKYHSMGYFTQINTVPAFLGKWWLEAGGNYYSKYYKEKGAITSQSISFCGRELFDLENDQFRHMNWEPYDHEHIALFCDPNYNQADNPYTPFLGAYSIRRRCLHGKETSDYQLEYGYKFWETYKDMPRVLRMDFIDAHEGTGNVVKYLDPKLEKFLTDLEENSLLDDTLLLFMADHGNNMPGFVSLMNSPDFNIEKYLPMMFMVVPNRIKDLYGDALSFNEQSLVTPWDIHNTLLHAAGAPINAFNPHGNSMFRKIPNERFSCRKMHIRDDFCMCK